MSPLQNRPALDPHGHARLALFDAWVIAQTLAGHDLDGEISRVSNLCHALAQRMADAPATERHGIWNDHLATLPDTVADTWVNSVAAVNPDDPPPEDDGWGPPLAFELPAVERFPLEIYPPPVARLIRHVASSIGCPPDFPAVTVLVVASAAIGRSASLLLKGGYFASASIYAACVGLAGDGKSPAIEKIADPMQRIDQNHLAKWKEDKARYDAVAAEYEEARKAARRKSNQRRTLDGPDEPADNADEGPTGSQGPALPSKPVAPILRRSLVRDTTIEAMDVLMEQNPRGLLQVFDEASAMITSMNQYRGGRGSDRQWYMSTWSGQPRTVDRKGNADNVPISVPHPFLSVIGGMVPDKIGTFCDEDGHHDGFIDRILFIFPDSIPKTGWREDGIPDGAAVEWSEIVGRLQALPLRIEDLRTLPNVVQFTPEGKEAWREMIDAHHAEQSVADFPQSLAGPWAKLEQYVGRIVLILHMLDLAADPTWDTCTIPKVSAKTVRNAARLLAYLKSHTRRVHEAMKAGARGEEGNDDVRSILKWIYRHQPESFTLRDLTRDLGRTFSKRPQALEQALAWLEKHNCIRLQPIVERPKGSRGRSRSRLYLVNPHLIAPQNGQNCSPSPLSSTMPDHSGDSGDSATEALLFPGEEDGDELPPF